MSSLLPHNKGLVDIDHVPTAPKAKPVIQSPVPEKAPTATWRMFLSLLIATTADTLGAPLGESFTVLFDLAVGFVLCLTIGRASPALLPALLLEAIPGVGLFPSWVTAVLAIFGKEKLLPKKSSK
jgi:hypothetical protein